LHGYVTQNNQNSPQGAQGYSAPGSQLYGAAAYQNQGGNWGGAQMPPQGGMMGQFNPGMNGLPPVMGAIQQGITGAMASGGIAKLATGGVYQPSYTNYQQTPYTQRTPAQLQAATAAFNPANIPVPTRPTSTGSAGYAIDPTQMVGSPAYQAMQAQIAAQQAAQQAQQAQQEADQQNNYASAGASGGLPKDFKHRHIQDGHLGSYSDGGRLLKGPGDGVSDGIPATIGGKQPARLADGEFVIPARIVSELGNGSTDAGAKRLYAMMDRIKAKRAKAKDIAADTKAYKYLPA